MHIFELLGNAVGLNVGETIMNVSTFYDNTGALVRAKTPPPQFSPRSKYYAVKKFCFCKGVIKRKIKLLKIDTIEQLGDLFTKLLYFKVFLNI